MVLNESMPVSEQLPSNPNDAHRLEIPAPSVADDVARLNRQRRMLLLRERRASVRHQQHIVEMQHRGLNRALQNTYQQQQYRSLQSEDERQHVRQLNTQQHQVERSRQTEEERQHAREQEAQ